MCSIILGMFRFSGHNWNHDNRQYDESKREFFERNAKSGILVKYNDIRRKFVIKQTNPENFVVQSTAAGILVQRNNVIGKPAVFEFCRHPRSVTRFC